MGAAAPLTNSTVTLRLVVDLLRRTFVALLLSLSPGCVDDAAADLEFRGLGECPKCQFNAAQVNGVLIST
jgi:hypothetical protein